MIIAVPLYRAPHLIAGLFETLAGLSDEIAELDGRLLLINDSVDDADLRAELDARLPALSAAVPTQLIENDVNLGFVRSANIALARGRSDGDDVILLNSDALPVAGAFREMAAVAYLDPMTAVVSPRSNNATICNSPSPERFRGRELAASLRDHEAITRRLPRVSYVPTAVGFCLYIRAFTLREFGLFDEIYGHGYNEENDFIRRCNQRGYRAVLANRAFVWHLGNASFAQAETPSESRDIANRKTLDERYPEYERIVRRHYAGPQYRAEYLLSGLVPQDDGRLRLLFDCRLLGSHHNGTSELVCRLVEAFAAAFSGQFDIAILADVGAFSFHGLDGAKGLRRCEATEARSWPFAVMFRIGQPFTAEDLASSFGMATIAGFLMLDTIALDCQHLDLHDLDSIWRTCATDADILGYISRFSRDQFRRRFAVGPSVIETVALCSTDIAEYRPLDVTLAERNSIRTILIVGNHYMHKAISDALRMVRRHARDVRITVLGVEVDDPAVESHTAGELTQPAVDDMYDAADVVLFPSHYEGFGLPIMHALARRKPVIARRRPAAIEIADRTPHADNLHLFDTLEEMVAAALDLPSWVEPNASDPIQPQSWGGAARQIGSAITRAIARYDHARALARQTRLLASGRQQGLRTLPLGAAAPLRTEAPVIRADFEEVVAMLDAYHAPGAPPWLDRLLRSASPSKTTRAVLNERIDDPAASIDNLELVVAAPAGLLSLQPALQRWIQRVAPGGRITIRVENAGHVDPGYDLPAVDAILVWLVGGGCVPLSRFADGAIIGTAAVKLLDWCESLAFDGDDRAFVEHCYARILGREGDPGGVMHHVELLHTLDRESVAKAFYLSRERTAAIRSRLSAYFGG